MTNSAVPRSGGIRTMFRLVGTCSVCTYSENLLSRTPWNEISTERCSRLNRLALKCLLKRLLIISSVGMRPRTIRSCAVRSTRRGTPSRNRYSSSVSTAPLSTPCSSSSISSCDRMSWSLISCRSLHHEAGEVERLDGGAAVTLRHDGLYLLERSLLQRFLARARHQRLVGLVAEHHDQVVAQHRRMQLQRRERFVIARHELDAELQIAHAPAAF